MSFHFRWNSKYVPFVHSSIPSRFRTRGYNDLVTSLCMLNALILGKHFFIYIWCVCCVDLKMQYAGCPWTFYAHQKRNNSSHKTIKTLFDKHKLFSLTDDRAHNSEPHKPWSRVTRMVDDRKTINIVKEKVW